LINNLPEDAKEEASKLSKFDMIKLSRIISKLFNASCPECKEKMQLNPQSVSNISDFCELCQLKQPVLDCFHKLEKLHDKIK